MSTTLLPEFNVDAEPLTTGRITCSHCGAPLIDAGMRESGFCCAGCSYVFRLVHEHGLDRYYKIKDNVTAPADGAVFQPRDYRWLQDLQDETERREIRIPELTLGVQGISCAGCVWLIEHVFQQAPGAREIVVNAQYGTMRLTWDRGAFSAPEFARKLQAFGYLAGVAGEASNDPESRGLIKRIGLCAAFSMNVMLFSLPTYFGMESTYRWAGLFGLLNLVFGTLSLLVGGSYFLSRAMAALRVRAIHIDLPISLGIVGAYLGSLYGWASGHEHFVYFDFVATFILLMLVGRWAQVSAVERNRRRLLRSQPTAQTVTLASGARVQMDKLAAGDEFWLESGQVLPVESRLRSGAASFSLASINGEAEPRSYRSGDRIPAGAMNISRTQLSCSALQGWSQSLLAQLTAKSTRQSERHRMLELIVKGYLIGIIVVAVLSGFAWWFASHDGLRTWAVVTAVLVVSCPCAVALAFPLADEMATVALRRRGVFVRSDDLWAKLSRVKKVVFDKTGTLTFETPVLLNPEVLESLSAKARAVLLALVKDNAHPVSECIYQQLAAKFGGMEPALGEVSETVGCGVEIGAWSLGRWGWRTKASLSELSERDKGAVGTVFATEGQVLAVFRFADQPRADAGKEIAALQQKKLDTYILSGDRKEKVEAMAQQLGFGGRAAFGEMSPSEKAAWVEQHGADEILMLGDGANDSLAFEKALCRGTPVVHRGVLENKADFYYLGRGLGGIRALFEVNEIRRRTQVAILVFSVAYNLFAVGLAVAGIMNPLIAAALMPINSLLTLAIVTAGMRRAQSLKQS